MPVPPLLTTLVVPALLLTACSSGGAPARRPVRLGDARTPRRATPGGTLRFALGASPSGVDPQQVGSNVSIYIARQLADSLTDQDPETGEIVPWLAQSWEVSDDLTHFTFHLRDDVTFSDGTPADRDDGQGELRRPRRPARRDGTPGRAPTSRATRGRPSTTSTR